MSKYCVGDVCEYDAWWGIGMCIILTLWDGHIVKNKADTQCTKYDVTDLTRESFSIDELMILRKDTYEIDNV